MLQDCLLILHVLTQIMTFNYYAIEVTFVSKSLSVLLHFIANTIVLFLLLFCIFAWKSCGFKVHFCIVLLHIAKLTIVCINFAIRTVHFLILYKAFLTVLITVNVCTILAESISMFYILKTHTNVTQQDVHELHQLA